MELVLKGRQALCRAIIRLCGGDGRRLWRVVFSGLSARRCSWALLELVQ